MLALPPFFSLNKDKLWVNPLPVMGRSIQALLTPYLGAIAAEEIDPRQVGLHQAVVGTVANPLADPSL